MTGMETHLSFHMYSTSSNTLHSCHLPTTKFRMKVYITGICSFILIAIVASVDHSSGANTFYALQDLQRVAHHEAILVKTTCSASADKSEENMLTTTEGIEYKYECGKTFMTGGRNFKLAHSATREVEFDITTQSFNETCVLLPCKGSKNCVVLSLPYSSKDESVRAPCYYNMRNYKNNYRTFSRQVPSPIQTLSSFKSITKNICAKKTEAQKGLVVYRYGAIVNEKRIKSAYDYDCLSDKNKVGDMKKYDGNSNEKYILEYVYLFTPSITLSNL